MRSQVSKHLGMGPVCFARHGGVEEAPVDNKQQGDLFPEEARAAGLEARVQNLLRRISRHGSGA